MLRESINARELRSRLEGTLGVSIRVLSQREEAELGYIGASFFRPRDEAVLLIDAGGTSTEISWGTGTSMAGCAGFPLGTHRVRRFLDRGSRARSVSSLLAGSMESLRCAAVVPARAEFIPCPVSRETLQCS